MRLDHRGFALRVQAGQQYRRLDLGTGHRQFVIDAVQGLAAMDVQRRRAIVLGVDARPHLRQRAGNPAHRALGQRFIANQGGIKGLRRQQTGEQAHAGAGVAAVQYRLRCLQAIHAHAMDDALRR